VTITPEGGRVLGCLVEKQLTTPQQYPLTMNALSLACSQATNRQPVMAMDDGAVRQALQELKELHLVRFVLPSHGRSVTRYRHVLDEAYGLDTARLALLALLLLRGPQTPGELRSRTGRMAEFDSPAALLADLEVLAGQPQPLVLHLPRAPGQKEERWQQVLAAEPNGPGTPEANLAAPSGGAPPQSIPVGDDGERGEGTQGTPGSVPSDGRRSGLEARVEELASEVADLRDGLAAVNASLVDLRRSLGE
jgi:uncharacterized protein